MKLKGIVVTGLAFTMLATGCGNVNDDATARRGAPNDALNVRNDINNIDRYTEPRNVRNRTVTPRRVNETKEPRLEVADRAADNITDLPEVQSCNVIVTNRNAYVAAVLDGSHTGELSREVEEKIANQVRKSDSDIRNVYVSVNPEFVERMGGYTNDLRTGRPVGGMMDQFTETVRRIFPTAR